MKKKIYEAIFQVTKTCNNGSEKVLKKSVYFNLFNQSGKYNSPETTIAKGEVALKEEHFYNIVHLETKVKTILFVE